MNRTYSELIKLSNFEERYEYLRLQGMVGEDTFGFDRYLNQALYSSDEWKRCRRLIIIRDGGLDLGCDGYEIRGKILIHHLNPITRNDIINRNPLIFDPENLICTSHNTHNAIHYGDKSLLLMAAPIIRTKNDTCPWKQ